MKASGWKRRIVAACKTAGTYGKQYTAVIDTLAAILEKRDDAEAQYQASGSLPIIEHTNKGGATNLTKNPALTLWDSLNHSALEHWRELGLTPSSYRKITGDAPKKEEKQKGLAAALAELED